MIGPRILPQKVTVEAYEGTGAYGPIYSDPVTVAARVETVRKLVRSKTGDEVVAEATVYVQPGLTCPPESLITLPGESVQRTTLTYREQIGERRPHYGEITTE